MSIDAWTEDPSLVSDILLVQDFEQFLEKYWEKSPLLVRASARHAQLGASKEFPRGWDLRDLLDFAQVEQLLIGGAGAPNTAVNIIERYVARPIVNSEPGDSRGFTGAVDSF